MKIAFDVDGSIWVYAFVTIAIIAPLAWIRTLERFEFGFIFAGIAIFLMIVVMVVLDSLIIRDRDNDAGPNW